MLAVAGYVAGQWWVRQWWVRIAGGPSQQCLTAMLLRHPSMLGNTAGTRCPLAYGTARTQTLEPLSCGCSTRYKRSAPVLALRTQCLRTSPSTSWHRRKVGIRKGVDCRVHVMEGWLYHSPRPRPCCFQNISSTFWVHARTAAQSFIGSEGLGVVGQSK